MNRFQKISSTGLVPIKGLVMAMLCVMVVGCAQPTQQRYTYTVKSEMQAITGTVVKMEWSKSADSFCAQGSDYYVLQDFDPAGEVKVSYVLDFSAMPASFEIASYVGKTVQCQGELADKQWTIAGDSDEQQPVNETSANDSGTRTFSCEVFRVSSM